MPRRLCFLKRDAFRQQYFTSVEKTDFLRKTVVGQYAIEPKRFLSRLPIIYFIWKELVCVGVQYGQFELFLDYVLQQKMAAGIAVGSVGIVSGCQPDRLSLSSGLARAAISASAIAVVQYRSDTYLGYFSIFPIQVFEVDGVSRVAGQRTVDGSG